MRKFTLKILIIAIILRLIPVLLSYNLGIGLDDMFQYDMLARSIESGNGYRWYAQDDLYLVKQYIHFNMSMVDYDPRGVVTSFRPPFYPMFLALIYFIFGTSTKRYFIARLIQALVSSSMVPLTYAISTRLFPDSERWNKTASWIIALYPLLIIYPLSLATENIFFVLVLGSVLILLKAENERKWYWFAFAGLLLGMTALTRSVALAFAGITVIWIWFVLKEPRNAVIVLLVVSICTLPWMVRNSLINHKLTGIESALGYDLYVGYHPKSTGTFQYGISLDLIPYLDDGLRDEIGQTRAIDFIKADPGRIPYLMVRRLGYFWGLERRALTYFYSNNFFGYIPKILLFAISFIMLVPFMVVSTSAILGFSRIRWNKGNVIILLFVIGYLLPHVLILGEDRFHLALIPFLAIGAAQWWGGDSFAVKERFKTRSGRIAFLFAISLIVLLVANWGLEIWRDRSMLTLLFGPTGNQTFFPY